MKIATLFSGIGAPEQAAKRVYKLDQTVFACEFDKFARQSYEANYDISPPHFHRDVNDLDATQYKGEVEILIGGSPCQAFSIAGLREGTEDERGQLIYQYIRVVEECRPEIIIYENVKGMMSITGGRTIKEFVQALRDIGYYCHYDVINTKDYGVPQNRERLFLVGFLDHEAYHRFHFADKQPLEKRLKDVLEDDVDEKYYLSDKMIKNFKRMESDPSSKMTIQAFHDKEDSHSATITAQYAKSRITDPYIKEGYINQDTQASAVFSTNGTSPTLCAGTHGYAQGYIKVQSATKQGYETATTGDSINLSVPNSKTRRGRVGKQVAQCLDTACNQDVVSERIRKLTPRECLRLQDFPDTFKIEVSDSQAYKQAGNSMSVNILEMIFNQIERAKANEPTNTLMDFIGETS